MLYEKASSILNGYPRPRVRITLQTGEVLETPGAGLASASRHACVVSTDGTLVRILRWNQVKDFELVPSDSATEFRYG